LRAAGEEAGEDAGDTVTAIDAVAVTRDIGDDIEADLAESEAVERGRGDIGTGEGDKANKDPEDVASSEEWAGENVVEDESEQKENEVSEEEQVEAAEDKVTDADDDDAVHICGKGTDTGED
jgi:hypothetical protein